MQLESTEDLLVRWGKWLNSGGYGHAGYVSPAWAMVRSGTISRGISVYDIVADDDAVAIAIDKMIAKLGLTNRQMKHALIQRYAWGCSVREIGVNLKISKTQAQGLIDQGFAWIDGGLAQLSA